MRWLLAANVFVLAACASAPQPYCIPPDVVRLPESVGPGGAPTPGRNSTQLEEEYARCKEREANERKEAELREEDKRAEQRDADRRERELRELEKRQAQQPEAQEPQPEQRK